MSNLLSSAQTLVKTILCLMPSIYQQKSLQALLGLFLEATGCSLPQHSQTVSASAISRLLNEYNWSCRGVIRAVRKSILEQITTSRIVGRRPTLHVILDLTTLEKTGKFKGLGELIRVYNGKRGLHLVVLYIALGHWRLPWGFRVYRGKGHPGCVQLALRLLNTLPKSLQKRYQVLVLVDTAFGSIKFFQQVRRMKFHVIAGLRTDRRLANGTRLSQLKTRGQQVYLEGLSKPVTVSWYWLKRDDGSLEKRYVASTKHFSWGYISRLGKRRWMIEGFFKTIKHRFGLHRFGQSKLLGVYRFLVLVMIAYLLAHWAYLWSNHEILPDWGKASQLAADTLFPQLVLSNVLLQLKRTRHLARQNGLDFMVTGWQYG